MPEPRDPIDDWLDEHVQPLPPPPGTLARIRKRARRRKLGRAAAAAAGAAAVIAVAAAIPQYAISHLRSSPSADRSHAAARPSSPSPSASGSPGRTSASTGSPAPVPTQPQVPPNFAPASVTFVGADTGWTLGQAGTPGQCGPPSPLICTSIARTDDGGQTWYGVPAPVAGTPDGSQGVSQIRFADLKNGWVFGPQLWATHDGGHSWTRIGTRGERVITLAVRDGTAYAVWARCSGGGADFSARCTRFTLWSAAADSNVWQRVPAPGQDLGTAGPGSSVPLVLSGSGGYLLTPGGQLLTGPVGAAGAWRAAGGALPAAAPCAPGTGQQAGLLLTDTGLSTGRATTSLAVICAMPGLTSGGAEQVFFSSDGGKTWRPTGSAGGHGRPASLSGSPSGTLVLATSRGIRLSADHGASWRAAAVTGAPAGGFSYVGMTTAEQGIAIPADTSEQAIWFTHDGGRTWAPVAVRS